MIVGRNLCSVGFLSQRKLCLKIQLHIRVLNDRCDAVLIQTSLSTNHFVSSGYNVE